MRALIRNLVIIAVALTVAAFSIVPPEKNLRLGRDLRGGVSLVYSVQLKPGDNKDVLGRVIDVLKDRVDPNGLSEIAIVQQGQDRIEVSMPLPNETVKRLKQDFETQLEKLDASTLAPSQFERLMRLSGQVQADEIARVAAGDARRAQVLTNAATAAATASAARDELAKVQTELKAGIQANVEQARLAELTAQVEAKVITTADAELAYDAARKVAMGASMTAAEVRRALELPNDPRSIKDSQTGERKSLPSPREAALERLRRNYPDQVAQLETVLEAFSKFAQQRSRLDDSADLKRLLRGAGVLDFRITVDPATHPQEDRLRRELRERGPKNVQSSDAHWYKINKIDTWFDTTAEFDYLTQDPAGFFRSRGYVGEEFDGQYFLLAWDVPGSRLTKAEGDWSVASAYPTQDGRTGLPAIGFEMNPRGAGLLNDLTKNHVGHHMAVVLDDQVYTAPTLQSKIGRSGQITGTFSDAELRYVIRVLAAGSLQAKLSPEPISESTLGPDLGLDNLRMAMSAGIIAFIIVGGFMIVYYFSCGLIAVITLLCNSILLLGVMALNHAAFTLPGIAGIILTFGMAVDANVLIYERMREEMSRGNDLRTSVRLGFAKAFSTIVDGNVTNLIVCVVLYYVGTQEIKGFAITMSIGVLTTLFSALVICRTIFSLTVDFGPWRRASMLPMAIPAIERLFHRNVDWIKLRKVFLVVSACYVGMGLFFVFYRGSDMLDNEFRGGTQVTLQFRQGEQPVFMKRQDVQDRVVAIGRAASRGDELAQLEYADVLPENAQSDGITSDQFKVRTLATDQQSVVSSLVTAFSDYIQVQPALHVDGINQNLRQAPVYRVIAGVLGEDIDRPKYRDDIKGFVGGAALVLEHIDPPPTLAALESRLARMRSDPDFSDTLARQHSVRILEGDERAVRAAVILVRDPTLSFFDNEGRWNSEVASREWDLAKRALGDATAPVSAQNFSPTIARSFKARAIVAVVMCFLIIAIYVWVRFGAINFALAAIVPLIHDVLTAVGCIALVEVLYYWGPTQAIMQGLGLAPFKIDLNMIAAFLTIIGYSLNDSIVVMDRIRETRGKARYANAKIINDAINQTLSRTLITSGTTLLAAVVLFIFGGEGMRGFAFALIIGIGIGTYSSIAISAPIVWTKNPPPSPGQSRDGKSETATAIAAATS